MQTLIEQFLEQMSPISAWQKRFLTTLFLTIILMRGRVNFRNLSRYSDFHEKTYSRQFGKPFDFGQFNAHLIAEAIPAPHEQVAAVDSSFVPKSGQATYGLDVFYHGSQNRPERGLEVSTLAVIDVTTKQGYTLSARQTPSQAELERMVAEGTLVPGLPDEAVTRIDFYAAHLSEDMKLLPEAVVYVAGDGHYAKRKIVMTIRQAGKHLISKFRSDANLRFLYTGPQKKRGAPRQDAGKVSFDNPDLFEWVAEVEPGLYLYTAVVNSVNLKCNVRLVYLLNRRNPNKPGYALLFSTDIQLNPLKLYEYYKARFHIEFLFRDAKQFTGLSDCQARHQERLHFHFNASLTALNLAKLDAQRNAQTEDATSFSMATQKRIYFNEHLMFRFMDILEIDPSCMINDPRIHQLKYYGAIAA